MRVLLPFYRPDSGDNSSSDEEQDYESNNSDTSRARRRRRTSSQNRREEEASPPSPSAVAAGSLPLLEEQHPTKVEKSTFDSLGAEEGLVNFEPKKASETYPSKFSGNENKRSAQENSAASNHNNGAQYDEQNLASHPTDAFAVKLKLQKESVRSGPHNQSSLLTECSFSVPPVLFHEANPRKRSSGASISGRIEKVAFAPIALEASSSTITLPETRNKIDLVSQPAPHDHTCTSTSSSNVVAKRPRTDSKPPAKDLSSSKLSISVRDSKMAVGGSQRRGVDSEDEGSTSSSFPTHPVNYWVRHQPPAENEPPIMQNQPPPAVALVRNTATSVINPDDPAQDFFAAAPDHLPLQSVSVKEQQQQQKRATAASLDQFRAALKQQGLEMVEQEGDGNCLFRAVSLQVYGQSDNHAEVRERCLDYMAANEEHYSNFVADEDRTFPDYIARKRRDGVHGNHAEIQAISELFNRPVEVYSADSSKPMNIFHAEYKTSDPPIRLSYHDGNHYNAVVDPLMPTA